LADTVQSFFLSPVKPMKGGWIWGAGPALLLPTATDDLLGAEKWGAGPTAVVLKQQNGWTYGALANHIWSFAGESGRAAVNATFLQPFVSFTTKKAMTFTLNTESTYDWQDHQWTVPMNLMVQQLVKIGTQPVALTVGGRYYADKPDGGPDWGLRFAVILLFPNEEPDSTGADRENVDEHPEEARYDKPLASRMGRSFAARSAALLAATSQTIA
jgi:hypothetical protein